MQLFTIGFQEKTPQAFFSLLKAQNLDLLLDIRVNNRASDAGFTDGGILGASVAENLGCQYAHRVEFAPTLDLLHRYIREEVDWNGYVDVFLPLMEQRQAVELFRRDYGHLERVCLLCCEPTPEMCHRRLFAELVASRIPDVIVVHL